MQKERKQPEAKKMPSSQNNIASLGASPPGGPPILQGVIIIDARGAPFLREQPLDGLFGLRNRASFSNANRVDNDAQNQIKYPTKIRAPKKPCYYCEEYCEEYGSGYSSQCPDCQDCNDPDYYNEGYPC